MAFTVGTSSCFQGSFASGEALEHLQPLPRDLDKTSIRQLRIAAAVERSKTEYKAEHAYTERMWLKPESYKVTTPLFKSQLDRQRLGKHPRKNDYMASSLYFAHPPDYRGALDLVMLKFDNSSSAKPLGGLSRELLDIGLNAAIKCQDLDNAIRLADSSQIIWKGQFAGIAASAADAYCFAGHYEDAVKPLLMSIAAFGVHYPIVSRLSNVLQQILHEKHDHLTATKCFKTLIDWAVEWKKSAFMLPIFGEVEQTRIPSQTAESRMLTEFETFNSLAVISELGLDSSIEKTLEEVRKRLTKSLDNDIQLEKSVKEL
nr:hypothetical protein L204_02066 [Cryptococcus depauperatus CBS 7855]